MNTLTHTPLADLDLNETARPKMPPLQGATDMHRRKGRRLAAIHRHYLSEMRQIAGVLERIQASDDAPESLREVVLHTDMAKNFAAAGSICGHQCRVLTMHHDIEEQSMFPALAAQGNHALTKIVDKLRAEHLVIHELLKRLGRAGDRLSADPSAANFEAAFAVFFKLRSAVMSHFGYEETELAEAIGMYLNDF
ncbi:hemerythrin domain-containing protein [Planktotalea sp.]|uniref:hemerythrin domain-containing protein n=1 Tax=Planktotalea sp. TaxID=2029877 RepID=UPI003D6AF954